MLEVKTNTIQLRMDDNNLKFSFGKGDTEWNWTSEYRPKMECKEGTVYFDEALEIHHELVQNGIGKGIRSSFAGFIWTEHIWMCSPVTKEMSAIIRDIV